MAQNGWDYYLGGGYEREDGWRAGTSGQNFNGFLNLGHFGAERGFGCRRGRRSRGSKSAGSLPESLYGDPQINFTPGDIDDLNMQQLNLTGYVPLGGGRGTLTHVRQALRRRSLQREPGAGPERRRTHYDYTFGGTADWRRRFAIGANSLSLRFGVDGSANWVHERIVNTPSEVGAMTMRRRVW